MAKAAKMKVELYTDEHLFSLVKQSEPKGLELLFKRYHQQLWIFAKQIVKDDDASSDIIQDVFARIWEKRDQTIITGSLKAYLYMAVKNHSLNKIQVANRTTWLDDSFEENESFTENTADNKLTLGELKDNINKAIDLLPPKCGLIFKLSRFQNLSYKQIAEALNISVKTVENQMGKALQILRKELHHFLSLIFFYIFFS